jgi:hypothetical protein
MTQWMDKRDATLDDDWHVNERPVDYGWVQWMLWGVFALSVYLGVVEHNRSVDFLANAVEAEGTVVSKWEGRQWRSSGTPKYVAIEFIGADGAKNRIEDQIGQRIWVKLAIGGHVPVW